MSFIYSERRALKPRANYDKPFVRRIIQLFEHFIKDAISSINNEMNNV